MFFRRIEVPDLVAPIGQRSELALSDVQSRSREGDIEATTWFEARDAFEQRRARIRDIFERAQVPHRRFIDSSRNLGIAQQGLDLGCERERAPAVQQVVMERLDPE